MLQHQTSGHGWLRVPQFGSTASYQLDGESGFLQCDLTTMIEVRSAGRGTLILEDGSKLDVRLTDLASGRAGFEVLGPWLGGRSQ